MRELPRKVRSRDIRAAECCTLSCCKAGVHSPICSLGKLRIQFKLEKYEKLPMSDVPSIPVKVNYDRGVKGF